MIRTAIDIGTNTILMLIADFDKNKSEIKTILDIQRIPRLGKGVDSNRNILPESIEKAVTILNEYKRISEEYNSEKIIAAATSFLRDSVNRSDFIGAVKEKTGIGIEILSGEDEAKLTFIGGIYDKFRIPESGSPVCTIDIGGGSTEISAGNTQSVWNKNTINNIRINAKSFDIGSVRIKEKFIPTHPPKTNEIKNAEEFIFSHLSQFDLAEQAGKSDLSGEALAQTDESKLIGVAGTITTLGAIKLGFDKFIPEKVDNLEMTFDDITKLLDMLSSKSLEELYLLGNYMEGRADIIVPGTLILKCFMEKFGFEKLTISTKGLRYGVFLRECISS